ncbi:MAG TPA: serine--tRNA ligase [Dehalococcoidia bacterium]|nr:serine--tRNA ligase [Dehalococcoidia bacterium]
MLTAQFIRENVDVVRTALRNRHDEAPIDEILALDQRRRSLLQTVESSRNRQKARSQEMRDVKDKASEAFAAMRAELRALGDAIKAEEAELAEIEPRLHDLLLRVPNIPHSSVPIGRDETENQIIRTWRQPTEFDFEPRPHWEIGELLGIMEFERATKISGSRFYALKGVGAQLERALVAFMIDLHVTEHGYTEIAPPYLVSRDAMVGTGQLPKFVEDMYHLPADDLFLIPTAEVPVTNLHRQEILEPGTLPRYYVAYSPCFRREAGSAGRDTRGLIRVHQFDKVELVKFVEPASSHDELEKLVRNAEAVLERLGLPYRSSLLCTGDLGFASAKTYDPEVWMPGQGRYVEISSCSNFEAFQARRARIQYRPAPGAPAEYVHTLNGSGLAVGRTMAAVIENYQNRDGTVRVPEALRPYLGGREMMS